MFFIEMFDCLNRLSYCTLLMSRPNLSRYPKKKRVLRSASYQESFDATVPCSAKENKCKKAEAMVKSSDGSGSKVPTFHIIREVYDSSNAHERFEQELDKALEAKVDYIIIEPPRLGDETGRWITVGNCLHKTAVASGIASLISSLLWRDRPVVAAPMCAISLFCTGLYTVSWNYDPCCQYQVENNQEVLNSLPLAEVSSPVILSYAPNTKTKYMHRGVTLLSAAFCAWQIWKSYK